MEKKSENNKDSEKKKSVTNEYDEEALRLLGLDGEGKQKPKKPVLYFKEAGLVIPVWGVLTLEKSIRWETKPKTRAVYGIVINQGMEPSQMCPVGEKSFWYEKENMRDEKFEDIVETMDSSAFKVTIV